ncbi:hypothetical protein [Burkholderia sp. BCC0322]|uniref:hypothetical protein n=1 Tax=unclassified Burkholderia TaxID=2613784 RepID=UPI00158C2414|nr:hypothetical protein [Burkholderia sp. BCC0322]
MIDALFKPIVEKLTQFVQTCLDNWAELDLGEDIDAAGDAIADGASDAADAVGEEAAEIAVDEVAAAAFIDLAAVAPPLAVLGALVAIPFIVGALEKKFILHFEADNFTDYDLEWKIEYMDEGTMTSQPQSDTVPKLGYATDIRGDQTTVQVAYQANDSSMNTSGFSGIGLLLHLTLKGAPAGSDVAAVISIPWIADNVVWLGDVPGNPNWGAIYDRASGASSQLAVEHGNLKFFIRLASGRIYIEAKNSGSCFFESSRFKLKVTDNSNGAIIGTVSFVDSSANWTVASNTNPDVLNVNIDNSGSQATITVTVAAS